MPLLSIQYFSSKMGVDHMQVLATPLLSMLNIKYSFCWILTAERDVA